MSLYADDSWVSLDSCDKSSKFNSKISSLLLRTAHIKRRKRTIQDNYLPLQKLRVLLSHLFTRVFQPCSNVRGQVRFTETPCILHTDTWIQTILLLFFFLMKAVFIIKKLFFKQNKLKSWQKASGLWFRSESRLSATSLRLVGKARRVKKKSASLCCVCCSHRLREACSLLSSAGLPLGCDRTNTVWVVSETHKPSFRCPSW